mgnify:CR=1 FL=1
MEKTEKLKLAGKEQVESQITTITIEKNDENQIDQKANEFVEKLVNFSLDSLEEQKKHQASVESMGAEVQIDTAKRLQLLQSPLKQLSKNGEEGGQVAKSLIDLKVEVEKLDPARIDLEAGWLSRVLGYIPGVGTPIKRYFTKFESAQEVIDAIMNSLKSGRDELSRDNITLSEDQKYLHASAMKLKRLITLAQKMDEKLIYKATREFVEDVEKKTFIEEKLIFPLRQKTMDFQQQLAVVQQGIISIEVIQRNNKELIRGVDRSLNVTINALQVAATVAMALNNQKIVMDKIAMINSTTDSLIANTAKQIKTQGVEIQKQAASTQLDINVLKTAFADINMALDDLSQFRQQALPEMAKSILEMDQLTSEIEKKVNETEKAKAIEASVDIQLENK